MSENEKLTQRIREFSDLRWPDRDLPGRLRKLGEEIGELNEAAATLCYYSDRDISPENYEQFMALLTLEVADVAILLQDILIVAGCEGSLANYMDAKMEVNERREWPVDQP